MGSAHGFRTWVESLEACIGSGHRFREFRALVQGMEAGHGSRA